MFCLRTVEGQSLIGSTGSLVQTCWVVGLPMPGSALGPSLNHIAHHAGMWFSA